MSGYTKLFSSILDSTVWQESKETRLIWVTMLVMKDRRQIVEASIPGLAKRAGVSISEAESALERLRTPDPYSRTQEHEGRRIKDVDGGWMILNGERYRDKMNADEVRAYKAAKQKEYRLRKKTISRNGACDGARQALKEGFASIDLGDKTDCYGNIK
jgi:hypothetical protein